MIFVAKLLDSLNQRLLEFDQSGEIGVEVWGLFDVFENGGERVVRKMVFAALMTASLLQCVGCIALKSFEFAQCSRKHL